MLKYIYLFLVILIISGCTANQYLPKTNDEKIYLISSSSAYDENVVEKIIQKFSQEGFIVNTKYLNQQTTELGYVNTDQKRAETLVSALSDPDVHYLWFIRGGAGALNLYPALMASKEKIKRMPAKIAIGFSDVTAVEYFTQNELKWPSIHGVLASYNKEVSGEDSIISRNNSILEIPMIIKKGVEYSGLELINNRSRKNISGIISGGNLTLIQSLFSTKYEINYQNKILIFEDTGVSYRQLDRTLHQLLFKKNFAPHAIIFGQFYPEKSAEKDKLLYKKVITNFAKQASFPVFYYPFFGHGATNQPFIIGNNADIICSEQSSFCSIKQKGIKQKNYRKVQWLRNES